MKRDKNLPYPVHIHETETEGNEADILENCIPEIYILGDDISENCIPENYIPENCIPENCILVNCIPVDCVPVNCVPVNCIPEGDILRKIAWEQMNSVWETFHSSQISFRVHLNRLMDV